MLVARSSPAHFNAANMPSGYEDYKLEQILFLCTPSNAIRSSDDDIRLRFEKSHNANDVLATDGTFAEYFAATGAGGHVATFQQHTFDGRVHANFAQIVSG